MPVHCFWVLDSNLDLNSNCLFVLKGNRIRKIKEKATSPKPTFFSLAPQWQPLPLLNRERGPPALQPNSISLPFQPRA
jgi:hypothetical protein